VEPFDVDRESPSLLSVAREVRGDARFQLVCARCGYGVIVRIAPEACPMCRGTAWEHARVRSRAAA